MKIDEVTEAPVSGIKQKAQGIGSRVLNKIGAKDKAANLAGKADFGATANKLNTQFNSYLGTQNKSIQQATGVDLDTFLRSKKVMRNDIPDGVLQKSQIDAIMKDVAMKAMQRQQGTRSTASDDAAPQDNAEVIKSLPPELKDRLSQLTTQQRQQLLSML